MDKIIGVKLANGNVYGFRCYDDNVDVCDFVVVDTKNGLLVGEVMNLSHTIPKGVEIKEVVSKVDFTEFNERAYKRKKLNEIKTKMDARVKELQDIAVYEMLAKEDTELASMLSKLKELM